MHILYAVRYARFDLFYAMAELSHQILTWDVYFDTYIYDWMCCTHPTLPLRQVRYVGDQSSGVPFDLYADADFAGDSSRNANEQQCTSSPGGRTRTSQSLVKANCNIAFVFRFR